MKSWTCILTNPLIAQMGTLCCIRELNKYLKVDSSHLVIDYKHSLSIKFYFIFLILSNVKLRLDWRFSANTFHFYVDLSKFVDFKNFQTLMSFLTYKIATTAISRFLTLLAKYFLIKIVLISHRVFSIFCFLFYFLFLFKKILDIECWTTWLLQSAKWLS